MINWYDRIGNRIEMKLYEDAGKPDFEWVKGNVIEGYRYRDGIISMKSDDGRKIWCEVESGDFRKAPDSLGDFITNADRIRSMNDEELADFLSENTNCDCCNIQCQDKLNCPSMSSCYCRHLEWLQSEVEK